MRVKTEAARILAVKKINPEGQDLDRQRLGRTNNIVLKSAIDRAIAKSVGRKTGERSQYDRAQLDEINKNFDDLVNAAMAEVFDAKD